MDLRTVFDDAMAYVMLSRVQAKNQLYIVGSLPEDKFRTSFKCLEELERLLSISVNRNPPKWEQQKNDIIKIAVLNCSSLQDKIDHIREDKILMFSDMICLTETWIRNENSDNYPIGGYILNLNSFGDCRGKGLAIYYHEDKFTVIQRIKLHNLQVTHISSVSIEVIVMYRSADCKMDTAIEKISPMIAKNKPTIICGDLNVCLSASPKNKLTQYLFKNGFDQRVNEATHIDGGLIDHVYFQRGGNDLDVNVNLYCPYYTARDHDALLIEITKNKDENTLESLE